MRTYTTLDLGTQRPTSRWRLAGLLGLFGSLGIAAGAMSGCVNDPDCGVCDPDNLILESIAGVNYAGKIVKLLGPECVGDSCPGEITEGQYFVEKVIPCIETDEAINAPRGVDEWCRVSPLIVDSGLQFIFNNLLDPQSVELVRKQAVNPQLIEVFDWKTHIVHLEGPITRFNGDYRPGQTQTKPDTVTRATNLACIENLAKQGIPYDHTVVEKDPTICDGTYKAEDGKVWPLKTEFQRKNSKGKLEPARIDTYRGETDTRRQSQSCTPPQSGADTCCDTCDYEVAVNVSKYGVVAPLDEMTPAGADQRRTLSNAIKCTPMGDKYSQCKDFIPHVYRGQEQRSFSYNWDGDPAGTYETFHVPLQDKLRETHPDQRWSGHEQRTVPCNDDADCTSDTKAFLVGMECVGELGKNGPACNTGDECINKRCVAEWFGDCRADAKTTGEQGYCVDKRWNGEGSAGCFTNDAAYYVCASPETCPDEDFGNKGRTQGKGSRFSLADSNFDGTVEAIEGCRTSLGGVDKEACDPLYQSGITPIPLYDRKETLPTTTRNCVCEDEPAEGCDELVDKLCRVDGDPSKDIIKEKKGQFAVKFVTRLGGVVYDPAIKGVQFLPADLGNMPRSLVEACSAARAGGAKGFSIKDGWRANDSGAENYEDFDRAMCSSSEYRVVFNTDADKGPVEYIRDKVGNTLRGKSTYVLHTPDFHVIPGSGFPTDNLRIGACDDFEIRFSNKYDLSAANLQKLQIVEITPEGEEIGVVAGGLNCTTDADAKIPCLTTNVRDQEIGAIRLSIDTALYGAVLVAQHRYRVKVPGIELAKGETVQSVIAQGGARYREAFWDACGMPLTNSMPTLDSAGKPDDGGKRRDADYFYDFNIDEPKPKEDKENDNVQFSCDNAPDNYNPDQADMDGDGFGDVVDKCPTIATDNNKADTDKDGIGNACDLCTRQLTAYNEHAGDVVPPVPVYMMVRNIPFQADYDQDGIGDVCDNCIVKANCGDFGPKADGLTPAVISSTVPFDNDSECQVDNDDMPFIGDACIDQGMPVQLADAAGPVGHAADDDFDQDGLTNLSDKCPRLRVELTACQGVDDCPEFAECTAGFCNHPDSDNDGVGDLCDTCPAKANPKQVQDGGMQADDPDSDFVGNVCETNPGCYDRDDARRIAFYTKSANGQCCVQTFSEKLGLTDPGYVEIDETTAECKVIDPVVPLTADCAEDQENVTCRRLPKSVIDRPGVVNLPVGCTEVGEPLTLESPTIKGDEDLLYSFMCLMPQLDSDFDGIGDACDLCEFSFDPDNSFYKDDNNKVWPNYGNFCRGKYDPEKGIQTCEDVPDTDTEGTGGTGGSTG
ncbi:MAG: thrombospondin type 3 repeat-containing protein [Nannocystis sp.]|uniref:thrombospondin type 3 repeat-containing protein n=1 Tax=Nannocystis sp. TaxID=1962667 RepID=UPI002425BBB1|nr:thrombospondin type 3 repeat-containing protein [Nannocystis sp.]MBK9755721.1 thrombospondin type 3 repeat-containing protein [Nannocystis sp.]